VTQQVFLLHKVAQKDAGQRFVGQKAGLLKCLFHSKTSYTKQFQDLEIRSVSKTISLSPMHARNMNGSEAKQDQTLLSHSLHVLPH